jgi:hypothetical protein
MLHHSAHGLAIAMDVDGWIGRGDGAGSSPLLLAQGWRTVVQGPRDRLDRVWKDLGRTASRVELTGR